LLFISSFPPQYKRRRFLRDTDDLHEQGGYQAAMHAQVLDRERQRVEAAIKEKQE